MDNTQNKPNNTKITFFKIETVRTSRRATRGLCICGIPQILCFADCRYDADIMIDAKEEAAFARDLDIAREFGD
jgi:hypothetical protein